MSTDKGKAFLYDNYSDYEKTLYQLNIKEKTMKPFEWPSEMFGRKKVVTMQVINTVNGCFENFGIYKRYRLQGDKLVWVKDSTIGNNVKDTGPSTSSSSMSFLRTMISISSSTWTKTTTTNGLHSANKSQR